MVEIDDTEVRGIVEHQFAHTHGLEAIVGVYRSIGTRILGRLCEPEEDRAFRQGLADLVNTRTLLAFFRLPKADDTRERGTHAEKLIEMYRHWYGVLRYLSANYDELPANPALKERYSEQQISMSIREISQRIDTMSREYAADRQITTDPKRYEAFNICIEHAFQAVLGARRYNQFVAQFNRAADIVKPYHPMARLRPDSIAH